MEAHGRLTNRKGYVEILFLSGYMDYLKGTKNGPDILKFTIAP